MVKRWRLSRQAHADLDAIWISVAGLATIEAANTLIGALRAGCQRLGDYPESAGMRADLADLVPGLRILPVGHYLILHRVAKGGVNILRIAHERRDLRRLLGGGR